jgi:hypothetical protein
MTLGRALAAKVRLMVWCKTCQQAEPAVADQVARYGADTTVIDWASRLRCSACDGRRWISSSAAPPDSEWISTARSAPL